MNIKNELKITCNLCGKEKKVHAKRDIHPNGNFCSQDCFQEWTKKNAMSEEERKRKANIRTKEWIRNHRGKWNQSQNKRVWEKRNSGDYEEWRIAKQIRKLAKEKLKIEVQRRKLERHQKSIERKKERQKFYRENGLRAMWDKNPERIKRKREYEKRPEVRIRRNLTKKRWLKLHPEKRTKAKGIKKEAFDKMRTEYNYTCPRCDKKEPFLDQYWHYLTQNHRIPISMGGKKRTKENIIPLCWNCNIEIGASVWPPINQLTLFKEYVQSKSI